MKRLALACLSSLLALGCATSDAAKKDDEARLDEKPDAGPSMKKGDLATVQVEAMRMMMAMQAAQTIANATCARYENREVPWPEEQRIGTLFAVKVLKDRKVFTDEAGPRTKLNQHVALVGRLLARKSSRPDLPWTFGVVESDVPDAQGLAGGYVFVTTGLLKHVKNEAELAAVLAHEIAHVAQRHPLQIYGKAVHQQCVASTLVSELARNGVAPGPAQQQLVQFAARFGKADALLGDGEATFETFLFDTTLQLAAFPPQEREYEADRLGAELMAFAGYDATQFDSILTTLDAQPLTRDNGRTFRTGWLANAPSAAERITKLKALRATELSEFAHGTAKPDLSTVLAPVRP